MGLHGNSWTYIENVERYQQTARNIHVLYRTNIARGNLDLHYVNPRSNKQTNKQSLGWAKWALGPKSGPTRFSVKKKQTKFVLLPSVFLSFKSFKESHYYGAVAHPDLKCYLRPSLSDRVSALKKSLLTNTKIKLKIKKHLCHHTLLLLHGKNRKIRNAAGSSLPQKR